MTTDWIKHTSVSYAYKEPSLISQVPSTRNSLPNIWLVYWSSTVKHFHSSPQCAYPIFFYLNTPPWGFWSMSGHKYWVWYLFSTLMKWCEVKHRMLLTGGRPIKSLDLFVQQWRWFWIDWCGGVVDWRLPWSQSWQQKHLHE